jgi:putative transposase
MQVAAELRDRGVEQIYIVCVDRLKGFTEAINSIFPDTMV